jgi:glycosyltransferase involved in cell wall biosynthesis
MDISVIVCTWNRSQTLAGVLESLAASVVPSSIEWEVVVVDNHSSDDTRTVCESFLERHPGRFRYLYEEQQGKSYALNAGIRHARGEILAFTDDDVTVDPHWVAQIYETFQQFDCAGVAGRIVALWTCQQPSWIDLDGPYRHEAYGGIVRFEKGDVPCELNCTAAGANFAFRKAMFEKYGLFRLDLSGNHADSRRTGDLLGGEDTEFCRRLLNAGEKLMYAPAAVVHHPVEHYRLNKQYLRAFAFNYGRYTVRLGGIPDGAKCYFGVPRYMFPIVLKFLAQWVASYGAKRRFFYRLQVSTTFGQMTEGRRWIQARRAQCTAGALGSAK